MLQNDEKGEPIECHCPRGKRHHFKCPWYNLDVIYIIDTKADLSTSEQAAEQNIYNMYQNMTNNQPENCGCGTAAAIAYMGHNTDCVEFQYINGRESYEVLLVILKKRKKVAFTDETDRETKKPRLDSTVENGDKDEAKDAITEAQKVPRAKEIQPNLSQATTDSLSVLADETLSTSNATQPNIPPHSLSDHVEETVGGADCPCEKR